LARSPNVIVAGIARCVIGKLCDGVIGPFERIHRAAHRHEIIPHGERAERRLAAQEQPIITVLLLEDEKIVAAQLSQHVPVLRRDIGGVRRAGVGQHRIAVGIVGVSHCAPDGVHIAGAQNEDCVVIERAHAIVLSRISDDYGSMANMKRSVERFIATIL
jgi:hypothetical protein